MQPSHLALMLLINLVWGFNLVSGKVGVTEFSPLLFTTLRFAVLGLVLAPFLRVHRGQMVLVLGIAMTMGGLHFALLFVGMALADDVSAIAIAIQLAVPFATVLSVVFLGERRGFARIAGISLACAGVMAMAFDPRVFSYLDGLALTVAAALCGAVGMLLMRRVRGIGVVQMQAWLAVFSLPLLLALTLLLEHDHAAQLAQAPLVGWAAVLYTALAASLVGHGGLYFLLQRYPVTLVAPQTLLATLFAVIFGVTILGDTLTARMVAGGALTLLGVFIVARREP